MNKLQAKISKNYRDLLKEHNEKTREVFILGQNAALDVVDVALKEAGYDININKLYNDYIEQEMSL